MIKYFIRKLGKNIVGMGYIDITNQNNMLFQTFEDCEYFEQEEVDFTEFSKIASKMDFEGFKPNNNIIPSSSFNICLN